MKKLSKFLLVIVLALGLACMGILAACNDDTTKGGSETKITDGRWHWAAENFEVSLKLKEDGTFYMSVFMAGNETAGTWELKDQQKTYYKIEQGATPAEGDDQTQYTAEQTLVLTSYSGTVYEAAYADDTLWQCAFPGMGSRTLTHDKDYEWKTEDEVSIRILSVTMPKDANRNLTLYHDGTLADQVNDYIEGTWTQTSIGYDLKDEDGEKYASVTQVADGKCTYTPVNGTALELYTTAWEADYTLTGEAQATMKGETEAETVTVTLNLWQDNSADVVVMDLSYQSYTVLSGSYEKNSDSSMTVTFGETEVAVSVPDAQGEISATINVPAGDIFEAEFPATVKGVSDITIYKGTASNLQNFSGTLTYELVEDSVQMTASLDGSYSISASVSAYGQSMAGVFASGTFTDEYIFSYTDADGVSQTAAPVLNENNQLVVTFVKLTTADVPGFSGTMDVTITLGNTWDFLAAGDYVTTDVTETYSSMAQVNGMIENGYLFMKDGKFELSFSYAGNYASVMAGTYVEENGEITFTVGDKTFTSNGGTVDFSATVNIGMEVSLSFSFMVENKSLVYTSVNDADTPYQTENKSMAEITAGHLTMRDGSFTVTFDAKAAAMGGAAVNGNAFCEGTYVTEDGVTTFTVTTAGMEKTFTTDSNGIVTFAYENYQIMGMFSGGTVTFVFDIVA